MKNTIIFIVIIAIIGLSVYKLSRNHTDVPVVTQKPSLSYFCTEGMLKATYSDQSVTLGLLDGRTITLPQAPSGSGVRYESDTMTFVTKGDYGTLTEGTIDTYTNCILGTDEGGTFTNGSHRFSFRHTNDMNISGGSAAYDTNWRNNTTILGQQFVLGTIAADVLPKTNFAGARFTVGTSADPEALKYCLVATNGEVTKGETTINNVIYKQFTLSDAGAGNFYDTTSYRAVADAQCYAIEYTIHSTNIGNYDPKQGIKEFNRQAVTSVLELAARSFSFLPQ